MSQGNPNPSVGDRVIPLQARHDLVVVQVGFQGDGYWILKDPIALRYHRLQPEQFRVFEAMQKQRSLEDLRKDLQKQFPTVSVRITDVQQLIADLHEKNLLVSSRRGQGRELLIAGQKRKWKEVFNVLKNFLFLRLPGWDPERVLNWMYPMMRWLFRPAIIIIAILFALSALLMVSVQFNEFRSRLPEFQQFFSWPNVLYMWMTIACAKVLHEFGHALSCKHFGGECHKIGLMLLVFSPTLYCDVTDSWLMKNKWHRIAIGGAGAFVEVVLSSFAIYIWWFTDTGLLNHLCLNLFFVTTVSTVVFNLNPLMRFDGYYMLSDYLEIPNLQQKSSSALQRVFAWYCLGIRTPEESFQPQKSLFWFALYAVAAWVYRWMIVIGIAFFLYTVLKPYDLQNIGIILGLSSLGTMIFGMGKALYKILEMPRQLPLSKPKVIASLSFVTILLVVIFTMPVPVWIQPSFVLEPYDVHHVYTQVGGQVEKVPVQEGDYVHQGDLLLQMKNVDLDAEKVRLTSELNLAQTDAKIVKAYNDPDRLILIQDQIDSIKKQLEKINSQLKELTVLAPCDGMVVATEAIPLQKKNMMEKPLIRWHGTVLDKRNLGTYLEAGTPVLSIAPQNEVLKDNSHQANKMQAVLLVEQNARNDLKEGQEVLLRCYHLPHKIYKAKITSFSDRQTDYAPRSLSNKVGGDLSTVSDQQGREKLTNISYQAVVLLEEDSELMQSGMRGRARIVVSKRTLGSWMWRSFRETFNFRL